MGEPAIAVRGLRKSFGAKEAVAGIDLEIAAGSFAGLVGPNGAGKTTSLSMMTGLLRPDGGQVLINGLDVWADPPAAKAIIGVVPAEARLFERLSGEELLEYAGRLRGLPVGEARSRAAQLLGVLDLTADAKRLVADYSTGMRKKATLGCALIHNPSVLFLDEPLEGVDPVSADVIRRLLIRFVGSGSTVLFSSHVMELVEQVCDHVSIINKGRIVAESRSRTFDQPRLALRRPETRRCDLTTVVFTIFAFGWLILPLVGFSLDGTLDPATLALYPLRTRPLAVGLLAASATGAWPLANLVALLGVTVGLARGGFGLFIALLVVQLEPVRLTLARFVTAVLAALLRPRRGKVFAAFLVIPIFALDEIFTQVVPKLTAEGKLTPASFAGVDVWMRWIPPGLAAHAIQDASTGRPGTALLRLALLAAVIVALGRLWIGSLGRGLVTVDTSTQSSAVRGAALPFGRYGLRGAVAARFWIYQRREPSSIISWCIAGVVMIAVSISTILTPRYLGALLESAALGAALIAIIHSNSIGMSGPSFGFEAMALTGRRALRAYFSGQNIALGMIAVPLLTVISFGLAALARHPVDGFLGMAVDLAGIGAALALDSVFTVTVPYPVEKRAGMPAPRPADGYTGYSLVGRFGSLFGTVVAVIPVVLGALFTRSDPAVVRMPVLVLCATGYGIALAWIGVRIAASVAEHKLPDLYQIAVRSKL